MFWNVASAEDEISVSKCSGGTVHLRTFRWSIGCENAFCWKQCFFTHSFSQGWANLFNGCFICRKPKTPASCKTSL